MTGQSSLPGLALPPAWFEPAVIRPGYGGPRAYKLFLAIFPDADVLRSLAPITADLCEQSGLDTKRVVRPDRLHITLHTIGDYIDQIPLEEVDASLAAANGVVCPPLPIVFDHALSFHRSNAYVLRCDARSDATIARLRRPLTRSLKNVGLKPTPSETPHMTMQYSANRIVAEHPIPPVAWTATRFALILSHVGLTHHQWISQWSL